jgi:hypothetical protein
MPVFDYDKGTVGFVRMEQQLAPYALTCWYLKVCKIFVCLFDMMLFCVYIPYRNIT